MKSSAAEQNSLMRQNSVRNVDTHQSTRDSHDDRRNSCINCDKRDIFPECLNGTEAVTRRNKVLWQPWSVVTTQQISQNNWWECDLILIVFIQKTWLHNDIYATGGNTYTWVHPQLTRARAHARTHARTHIKFTNIQTASNEYKPKHFKGSALLQRFQNQHSTVQGTVHYKCTAYAQASTISGTVLSPRQKEALSLSSVFCSFSVSILL